MTRLADDDAYRRWAAFASREERIVAYADKRATQRIVSMDERFAGWLRRHGSSTRRSRDVSTRAPNGSNPDVCAAAGVPPDEVGRLRWTSAALRAAQARPTGSPGAAASRPRNGERDR